MTTLAPILALVKPTPSDLTLGDRLAFLADDGDPDAYRAGWDLDAQLDSQWAASLEAEAEDAHYESGCWAW